MGLRMLRNIQTGLLTQGNQMQTVYRNIHIKTRTVTFKTYNKNIIDKCISSLYVTGFQKTDQNVTLGLFHFTDQANSYTHSQWHYQTSLLF